MTGPRHVFYPAAFLHGHGLLGVLNEALLPYALELRATDDGAGQLELVEHAPATTPRPANDAHAATLRHDHRWTRQAEALVALASRHPGVLAVYRDVNGMCTLEGAVGDDLSALMRVFHAPHLRVEAACPTGSQRLEWAGQMIYRKEPGDV